MASDSSSLTDFAESIFSYNSNIMLAALISLLLVLLFVLLLHAYAKCFFPRPRPRRTSVAVSYLLRPSRLPPLDLGPENPPTKGLDQAAIAAIPLFVCQSERPCAAAMAMGCVICLSEFEERELGRRLPKCGHGFHLECIDMWLNSHANCPVCRAPVVCDAASCPDAAESGGYGEIGGEVVVTEERNCEIRRDEGQNGQSAAGSSSSSSSSSLYDPPLMSLGASLKRMLSRNRSEGRIFPSSNGVELDV